jgi:hypothetical protein
MAATATSARSTAPLTRRANSVAIARNGRACTGTPHPSTPTAEGSSPAAAVTVDSTACWSACSGSR